MLPGPVALVEAVHISPQNIKVSSMVPFLSESPSRSVPALLPPDEQSGVALALKHNEKVTVPVGSAALVAPEMDTVAVS